MGKKTGRNKEKRADKRARAHDKACKSASRVTHTPQSCRYSIILPSGHDRPYLSDFSPSHPPPLLLSPATPTAVAGRTLLLHTLNTCCVSSLFIGSNASNHERDFAPSVVCFQFGLRSFTSLYL